MTRTRALFPFVAPDADQAPGGRAWRKRLAVLLAAITVPAMAATGGVGTLPGPAVESTAALATRQAAAAALPFERRNELSGSAFYYMPTPSAVPSWPFD